MSDDLCDGRWRFSSLLDGTKSKSLNATKSQLRRQDDVGAAENRSPCSLLVKISGTNDFCVSQRCADALHTIGFILGAIQEYAVDRVYSLLKPVNLYTK